MGILRKLFWFALFLVFTLLWVTLFEHGTEDFSKNVKMEFENFKSVIDQKVERPPDTSDSPEGRR